MLIAQITDVHIGFAGADPAEPNRLRFSAAIDHLLAGPSRPDLLLLSGDLTEYGNAESYAWLADAVRACPFPVWPMVGNHDSREGLRAAFPQVGGNGFVHYALDIGGLRLLALDTLEPGRHGGGFCAARADWLSAELAAHPDTPTVIAMHHPPLETGITWLDSGADEAWIARFTRAIAGHRQIRAVLCGHLHRTIHTLWQGAALTVCPSAAPMVALDLTPLDPGAPDGRAMVAEEPPGYALHRWDGERLISHIASVGPWPVIARHDARMAGIIHRIAGERAE